jgi:hypothetical protein
MSKPHLFSSSQANIFFSTTHIPDQTKQRARLGQGKTTSLIFGVSIVRDSSFQPRFRPLKIDQQWIKVVFSPRQP